MSIVVFIRILLESMSNLNEIFQLTEIQSNKIFSSAGFASKVLSLHNILQLAVSTYVSNARNFLDRDVPPKIEELLSYIQLTTVVCVERMLFDEEDFVVRVSSGDHGKV